MRTPEENREIYRQRMAERGRIITGFRSIQTGGAKPERKPPEALYPCRYLLPVIEKTDAAGLACSCPGKWLRGCEVHGQCRIEQESVDGCCRTCEQRSISVLPASRE